MPDTPERASLPPDKEAWDGSKGDVNGRNALRGDPRGGPQRRDRLCDLANDTGSPGRPSTSTCDGSRLKGSRGSPPGHASRCANRGGCRCSSRSRCAALERTTPAGGPGEPEPSSPARG